MRGGFGRCAFKQGGFPSLRMRSHPAVDDSSCPDYSLNQGFNIRQSGAEVDDAGSQNKSALKDGIGHIYFSSGLEAIQDFAVQLVEVGFCRFVSSRQVRGYKAKGSDTKIMGESP